MNIIRTVKILESLAQETRLKAFKVLVKAGLDGMTAGKVSKRVGIPQNTMSFHLSRLENSGLIKSKKQSRYIIYRTDFNTVERLIEFLLENCCFDSENKCRIATNFIHLFEQKENKKYFF